MNSKMKYLSDAQKVLQQADLIYSAEQINQAIDLMAQQINQQ